MHFMIYFVIILHFCTKATSPHQISMLCNQEVVSMYTYPHWLFYKVNVASYLYFIVISNMPSESACAHIGRFFHTDQVYLILTMFCEFIGEQINVLFKQHTLLIIIV